MPAIAFISHANANRKYDKYLEDFVSALRIQLYEYNFPGIATDKDCAFFDYENIDAGVDWERRIAQQVNDCKVLVAFCSPHFVSSRFCGKEFHLFLDRMKLWEKANPGKQANCVIPVLWFRTENIPVAIPKHQFFRLPANEFGPIPLRQICQLNMRKHRTKVLIELAQTIHESWLQNLPPTKTPLPPFDKIPSAFDDPIGPPYGLVVIDLLNVGDGSFTLDQLVSSACDPTPFRFLDLGANFAKHTLTAKANREVILIVANPAMLADPLMQKTIAAVDATGGEETGLIIFDTKSVDSQIAKIAFPNSHAKFWELKFATTGEAGQRQALSEMIEKLRDRRIKMDPAAVAQDTRITDNANANGVPINRKPNISGPEAPR